MLRKTKMCSAKKGCGLILDQSKFAICSNTSDGLYTYCRKCAGKIYHDKLFDGFERVEERPLEERKSYDHQRKTPLLWLKLINGRL